MSGLLAVGCRRSAPARPGPVIFSPFLGPSGGPRRVLSRPASGNRERRREGSVKIRDGRSGALGATCSGGASGRFAGWDGDVWLAAQAPGRIRAAPGLGSPDPALGKEAGPASRLPRPAAGPAAGPRQARRPVLG